MPNASKYCPGCAVKGKAVNTQTVKAMLAVSLTTLRPVPYYFCRTPNCPIVYFTIDGQQTFTEADLRERVYQKHSNEDDIFVCYCFRHSRGTIRIERAEADMLTVLEQIKAGIDADQCACAIRNPQGDCCLGNIIVLLKRMQVNASTT